MLKKSNEIRIKEQGQDGNQGNDPTESDRLENILCPGLKRSNQNNNNSENNNNNQLETLNGLSWPVGGGNNNNSIKPGQLVVTKRSFDGIKFVQVQTQDEQFLCQYVRNAQKTVSRVLTPQNECYASRLAWLGPHIPCFALMWRFNWPLKTLYTCAPFLLRKILFFFALSPHLNVWQK